MPGDTIAELKVPAAYSGMGMVLEAAPQLRQAPSSSEETQKQDEAAVKVTLSPAAQNMLANRLAEGEPPVSDAKSSGEKPEDSDDGSGERQQRDDAERRNRRDSGS